jgi:hypothetical protein
MKRTALLVIVLGWALTGSVFAQALPVRPTPAGKRLMPVWLQGKGGGSFIASGQPAGGVCPSAEACALSFTPKKGEPVFITAVWSATKIECDGATAAAPPGGAPIAPWWRCEQRFAIEGPGAGWTGFTSGRGQPDEAGP